MGHRRCLGWVDKDSPPKVGPPGQHCHSYAVRKADTMTNQPDHDDTDAEEWARFVAEHDAEGPELERVERIATAPRSYVDTRTGTFYGFGGDVRYRDGEVTFLG